MKKAGIILIPFVLAACVEQEVLAPVTPVHPDGQTLIVPSASVAVMEATGNVMSRHNAPNETTPATRGGTMATTSPYAAASGNGLENFTLWAYAGTAEPTNWTSPYFSSTAVNATATGFETETPKYFPADGTQKVYFYASAPVCGSSAGNATTEPKVVHYFADGKKDVMWAKDVRGITKSSNPAQQTQPSFLFRHVLKQVQFKVKIDDTFEVNQTLTKLTVKSVYTQVIIGLVSGNLSWGQAKDIVLDRTASPVTLTTTPTDAGTLMFDPAASFTLEAVVGGVTYSSISVTLTGGTNAGAPGTANVVTLTFKRAAVSTSATLTNWNTTQSSDIDVDKDGTD